MGGPVDGRPRPQLWRPQAASLDGAWDFAPDPAAQWRAPDDVEWGTTITVPFAPGTPASGVPSGDGLAWWYRSAVRFPEGGPDDEQVVHLGAVDHAADVWVDGVPVAHHEGGYTPVRAYLQGALASPGEHVLVVRAVDDHGDLAKPRGKQTWEAEARSIWYPPTSGIWQPTWTERLRPSSIDALWWRPDVSQRAIGLDARLRGAPRGCRLTVELRMAGEPVASETWEPAGALVWVRLPRRMRDETWSPSHPVLIDAALTLRGPDGEVLDRVESYTALRSVGTSHGRLTLNGRPVLHRLALDQGYWPGTGMTAPSDDALRRDVELAKALGFNGVRKHQKVEDPRYLWWADHLGLMVWEELPAAQRFDDIAVRRGMRLWQDVVVRDRSHPCVVGWGMCNESWGVPALADRPEQRAYVRALASVTAALDPDRPVVPDDGGQDLGGDVRAVHDYERDPGRLATRWSAVGRGAAPVGGSALGGRPLVLSEFGGMTITGSGGWGYDTVASGGALAERYEALLAAVHRIPGLSGFCYTQFTDTYQETNGLLTAGREPKAAVDRVRAATVGEQRA